MASPVVAPVTGGRLMQQTAPSASQLHEAAVPLKTWIAVVGSALGAFLAILNIQIVSSSLADIQGAIGAGVDDR